MATHSSILAWEISGTEEPGRLQSMGLQRVRHNRATNTQRHSQFNRLCFPEHSDGKESACQAGEAWVQSLGSGRFPGGGHGNTLQYSCLENSVDRGAWGATVHGIAKSQTGLSD